jgi:hypothetical protein
MQRPRDLAEVWGAALTAHEPRSSSYKEKWLVACSTVPDYAAEASFETGSKRFPAWGCLKFKRGGRDR